MGKLLEKLLRITVNKLATKYSEPSIRVPINDYYRALISYSKTEVLLKEMLRKYGFEGIASSFRDSIFLVTDTLELVEFRNRKIDDILEEVNTRGLRIIGAIREWPTIPPHFLASDYILASELDIKALLSFSKKGAEVHVLAMKGDWLKCLQVRRYIVDRLFKVAESFVPKLSSEKIPYLSETEIDEISLEEGVLRIYPEILEEKKWRNIVNLLVMSYLGASEYPQYIFFRLI
ncbi:MAG: hypothetical protein ACTSX9_10015 [Candidatus Njordarchaeales archaeon]